MKIILDSCRQSFSRSVHLNAFRFSSRLALSFPSSDFFFVFTLNDSCTWRRFLPKFFAFYFRTTSHCSRPIPIADSLGHARTNDQSKKPNLLSFRGKKTLEQRLLKENYQKIILGESRQRLSHRTALPDFNTKTKTRDCWLLRFLTQRKENSRKIPFAPSRFRESGERET